MLGHYRTVERIRPATPQGEEGYPHRSKNPHGFIRGECQLASKLSFACSMSFIKEGSAFDPLEAVQVLGVNREADPVKLDGISG
jgi:hypothetical protein